MQPSDFLAPFGRGFGSPCQRPTPMQELVLCRLRGPLQTRGASETGHRLSARPDSFEERRGPPRFLGRPLPACRGATPRRTRSLLAPTSLREDLRRERHRLRAKQNARRPEWHSFRGHNPTAHVLACLRFASLVAETVARLATGPGGLTPGRAGFAPAGRRTKFHGVIATLQFPSTSRAWSHCNPYARPCGRDSARSRRRVCPGRHDAAGAAGLHDLAGRLRRGARPGGRFVVRFGQGRLHRREPNFANSLSR
jgi:hypothetical protein